jgi:hypothetical protein
MTYLEAAVAVLKGSGTPMTASEITRRAIERRLLRTQGKTPAATMSARLYIEIAKNPNAQVQRVFIPAIRRARRGSVRWTYVG